uniref:Synaptobrevin, longin-like domain protein n=1 Tax=Tanacetum cinerariifolium TaxID=118510 RepID=A0A699JJR1_TANCI|nr:synaptobrevin, longin-like domain protein [Tanacetum cinerariifolium]
MSTPTFAKTHNLVAYLEYPAKVKTVNDEVQTRVNIKESFIRRTLRLDNANGISRLTNVEIFEGLAKMSAKTTSWNEFNSTMPSAIICLATNQKFNFSRYILLSLINNIEAGVPFFMFPRKHTQESKVPSTESLAEQTLPSSFNDPLPSDENSLKLKELMDLCTNLSNKSLELESEIFDIMSTYQERIKKLESRVERLEEENKVLKELKSVHSTDDVDEPIMEKEKSSKQGRKFTDIDVDVEINLEKAQAEAYNLDLDHQEKVLSMMDVNDEESADVEEVLEVVEATKVITEVVTTAGATKVSVPRKRRGVIIQDPKETTTTATVQPKVQAKDKGKAILIEKPKPLKRQVQIELDREVNEGVKVPETEVRQEKDVEVESSKEKIIPDDDDDVYTDATPLASKIPIVDYKIHTERNRPYFEIIRADGKHMLFISFSTAMKNFDREDLESLWKIVKDRFEKTEPKNYSDDYLLNTLNIMFEKPNVEASVWKDQKGRRLQVEDESEMLLELLRLVRRQLIEGYVPQ